MAALMVVLKEKVQLVVLWVEKRGADLAVLLVVLSVAKSVF